MPKHARMPFAGPATGSARAHEARPMGRRQLLRGLAGAAVAAPLAGGLLRTTPAAAQVSGAGSTDDFGSRLQELLNAQVGAGLPGCYAYVRNGGKTYETVAGLADVTSGAQPQSQTHHRIGGATKSFTAVAVLHLVGERKVDLDKPIGQYLPGVLPSGLGTQVTVRMLLNHTSGLSDFLPTAFPEVATAGMIFTSLDSILATESHTYTPQDLVNIGLQIPMASTVGGDWSYSNVNYVLLGMLLEKITGRTYQEAVTRSVLGPLGLRDTYFPGTGSTGLRGPSMTAYVPWTDGALRDFTSYNMSWAWASSDVISTAADMSRFYRLLLGGRVLQPALLREMKSTVPMSSNPAAAGYGLGIYWVGSASGHIWGHNGLAIGHTAYTANSEDGETMQMVQFENLSYYETLIQQGQGSGAIDKARQQFQSAAQAQAQSSTMGVKKMAAQPAWTSWLPQVLPAALRDKQ